MKRIILITGGERSGKSSYAEELALRLSSRPTYLATARIWDEEFRRRVERHQARRTERWDNLEEEKQLSRHDLAGRVVVIDCVTLWATNFFFDLQPATAEGEAEEAAAGEAHVQRTLEALKAEFDRFTRQEATFVFVTNEIGLGGVPAHPLQRRFADLLGWFNQYIARHADEVVLMVSGIPLYIKGKEA